MDDSSPTPNLDRLVEMIEAHAHDDAISSQQEVLLETYGGRRYGRFVAVDGGPESAPVVHIDIDLDENDHVGPSADPIIGFVEYDDMPGGLA